MPSRPPDDGQSVERRSFEDVDIYSICTLSASKSCLRLLPRRGGGLDRHLERGGALVLHVCASFPRSPESSIRPW